MGEKKFSIADSLRMAIKEPHYFMRLVYSCRLLFSEIAPALHIQYRMECRPYRKRGVIRNGRTGFGELIFIYPIAVLRLPLLNNGFTENTAIINDKYSNKIRVSFRLSHCHNSSKQKTIQMTIF